MKYLSNFWIAVFVFLSGCSFDVINIQSIDIDTYAETTENVKLIKDLLYYDPRYIAYKVPNYNKETAKGIKLGFFLRSSDGKPSYRITYSMKNSAVAKNIDSLQSDFQDFIPKLAAEHASRSELFEELTPKGQSWIKLLFDRSADEALSASSSLLRGSVTSEQLSMAIKNISSKFGVPVSTDFVRAQYYEKFTDAPESVSLFYMQTYKNKKKVLIRVGFCQENKEWKVMGFRFEPYSI